MFNTRPPGIIWNVYDGSILLGIVNECNKKLAQTAAGWQFMRQHVYVIKADIDARHRPFCALAAARAGNIH